ncbi:MAG: hypothetical protein HAW62_04635 [Endozoicomonadaceae bacterium]|nr:hypothetical protein [Endozoicomonadaceae bacterium]
MTLTDLCANLKMDTLSTVDQKVVFQKKHPKSITIKPTHTEYNLARLFLINVWQWSNAFGHQGAPAYLQVGDKIEVQHHQNNKQLVYIASKMNSSMKETVILTPKIEVKTKLFQNQNIIKYDCVQIFLKHYLVFNKIRETAQYPNIIGLESKQLLTASGDFIYTPHSRLYDKYKNFDVMRKNITYKHPNGFNHLGIGFKKIGEVTLDKITCNKARLQVNSAIQVIKKNDILIPSSCSDEKHFILKPASRNTIILNILDSISNTRASKYALVVLLGGMQHSILPGHVFAIYEPYHCPYLNGSHIKNANDHNLELDNRKIGLVMVYQSFQKLSYALVLEANKPLQKNFKLGPASLKDILQASKSIE